MEAEPTSACTTKRRATSLAGSFGMLPSRLCPCGDETIDGYRVLDRVRPVDALEPAEAQ